MTVDELKTVLSDIGIHQDVGAQTLREEVGLDSLGIAELALVLRREHGITVTEEALARTVTVSDVAEVIATTGHGH
jgi:acyl carrier protein